MSSSKKMDLYKDFAAVFIWLPPLLGFCLEWSSNFVGSGSGQIQSIKLLQNMVSNRTPSPAPSQPRTICIYCTLTQGREGGVEQERRLEGQQFTMLGRKYQHD
jgi:hypothetical protein